MKQVAQYQRGITFTGIFLILVVVGCFVIFALRLFPLYSEYFAVTGVMESMASEHSMKNKTTRDIRKRFVTKAGINNLERFSENKVKELVTVTKSKDGNRRFLNVKYRAENRLFKDVFLMMDVDETVELGVTSQ